MAMRAVRVSAQVFLPESGCAIAAMRQNPCFAQLRIIFLWYDFHYCWAMENFFRCTVLVRLCTFYYITFVVITQLEIESRFCAIGFLYQRGNCVTNVLREMLHTCSRAGLRNIVIIWAEILRGYGEFLPLHGFFVIAHVLPYYDRCAIAPLWRKFYSVRFLCNCAKTTQRNNFSASL